MNFYPFSKLATLGDKFEHKVYAGKGGEEAASWVAEEGGGDFFHNCLIISKATRIPV